jgi:hypothetical protein
LLTNGAESFPKNHLNALEIISGLQSPQNNNPSERVSSKASQGFKFGKGVM